VGRKRAVERFAYLLGRLSRGRSERSLIIHRLRGIGKTVLLTEFASRRVRGMEGTPP